MDNVENSLSQILGSVGFYKIMLTQVLSAKLQFRPLIYAKTPGLSSGGNCM